MSTNRTPARANDAGLDDILATVQKPLRYIGGEWNQVRKDHRKVALTFALAFPDVYEIGMSHLGFRILYGMLNARADVAAERVFCPWPDMADALRRHRRPLATLETDTPLGRFDVVGFSLQYEMTFTNVLEMLDLSGIPIRADRRGEEDPLVLAGGPVIFNSEPVSDFVDLVIVGDAEELLPEVLDALAALKRDRAPRPERVARLAQIEGVYAPSLYRVEDREGLLIPLDDGRAPYPVRRRIVYDLDRFPFPDRIVVPHAEIVHDRVSIEIMRGCPVGCRFCQAGYVYRPTRERDPNQVRDAVIRSIRSTGYDEFSLASLNTGEYGAIQPLLFDLMDRFEPEHVSVSLSSMHASTMTEPLARQVRRVRKSGFTIAPEAGTQRLRDVINKNLTETQILEACRLAFDAGWDLIKLYFMIGLPTETESDVDGLVDLAHAILGLGRSMRGRRAEVTLSASSFVPKPVTPFQWMGQERSEGLYRKQERIAARVRRGVRFKRHDCETTFLEAVFSRGDRRLGAVIERAWRMGARFDGWHEHFSAETWSRAFRDEGIDPERYAHEDWSPKRDLPWDVIDAGVNKKWLALELRRAMEQGTLSICGPTDCHGCAPFARECVKGVVARTTGRPLDETLPVLATAAAPGPGAPARREDAPPLLPPAEREEMRGSEAAVKRHRYRLRYAKTGRARFLGHLDLARTLHRGLRRARVPLVYSQGFNPKPKVQFGPALPLGMESVGEYLDFETSSALDPRALVGRLNELLPDGISILAGASVPERSAPLGEAARGARYRVHVSDSIDAVSAVERFLRRGPSTIVREKKGKSESIELCPSAIDVEVLERGTVILTLPLGGGGKSLRADEVAREVFGGGEERFRIVREDLLSGAASGLVSAMLDTEGGADLEPGTSL